MEKAKKEQIDTFNKFNDLDDPTLVFQEFKIWTTRLLEFKEFKEFDDPTIGFLRFEMFGQPDGWICMISKC